jgi:hypothetical protein
MEHRRLLPTLLLVISTATVTMAQENDPAPRRPFQGRQSTLGGGLEMAVPVGDFNNVWGRNFWGFGANFTYPGRLLPFDFGFDFGYARMGTREAVVYVREEGSPDLLEGDLTVRSKVYSFLGQVRLRPVHGRVSPYVEGLFGARQFTTRSDLVIEDSASPDSWDRQSDAWTGAYGWAVGTLIGFGPQFYVEGRVERLYSGRVSYADPESITIATDGGVDYATLSSATDVVNVQVGMGIRF